jgi:hypothetical protein
VSCEPAIEYESGTVAKRSFATKETASAEAESAMLDAAKSKITVFAVVPLCELCVVQRATSNKRVSEGRNLAFGSFEFPMRRFADAKS